jgi:uncharacterized membrane protein
MREWLAAITEPTIVAIDGLALIMIAYATLEAMYVGVRLAIRGDTIQARKGWLRYGRWLVAALTLQLGADIIESSISTDWESIARLGAIAVIRTFLNYFLERDMVERKEDVKADEAEIKA